MWERIVQIFKKEMIQIFRDKRMRAMVFLPPIVQLIVFGYAATTDVKHISLALLDEDRTTVSRDFVEKFEAGRYFSVARYLSSPAQADVLMDKGEVDAFIYIKKGFEQAIKKGDGADVLIVVDGTNSNMASVTLGYVNRIVNAYSEEILTEKVMRLASLRSGSSVPVLIGPTVLVERTWFNEDLESRNYFIPGIVALLLTLIAVMMTSMAIVKEREVGTMEQLIVTPIRPIELIVGKLLPFAVIGYIDVALITAIGTLWFGVPLKGSIPLLFFSTAFFLLPALGVGLFISTISATQQEAMLSTFLFFFPAMLMSGFVFPIDSMPPAMQIVTYADPMRYMIHILRGIFLKGLGVRYLWVDFLGLFVLGTVVVGFAVMRFSKRLK
ncbi:MAG: ABC transporter permease [Deltaproteobacteria bacterium]|nr:ABC transporter permease [Candidatus Zymogenaceae bacterium]